MTEEIKANENEPRGKIRYIGFDKDGTLMDSMASYAKIWGKIFHDEYGIDQVEAGNFLIQTAGQPTVIQVDTLLRNNNIVLSQNELFSKANEIATVLGEKADSKPFPEVPEVLKKLKEEGYKIFVSSGQQESVIKKDLERAGLLQYIDFFAGIRPDQPDYKKGEPHFRAAAKHFGIPFETFAKETVFIGDTPTDVQVSNNSNIISIVRKSANADETLLDKGAKFVVEDFSNLSEIISAL